MRSRYSFVESDGIYFLTCTVVEWIPAFTGGAVAMLFDALTYCRQAKSLKIYAFVIMDNHLHLVAEAPNLSRVVQSFKRHTARRMVELAEAAGQDWLLNQLAYYKHRHKIESNHQVWQEGSHPQLIQNDAMLRQKIQYIHDNPVRRGWVDLPEHWRWSSARVYLGEVGVIEIDELPL